MSASWTGSMRGPRAKTPLLLLLLLLLLNALTGTVLCQEDEAVDPEETGDPEATPSTDLAADSEVAADPEEPEETEETPSSVSPTTSPPTGSPPDPEFSEADTTDGVDTTTDTGSGSGSGEPPAEEPLEEGLSPIIILIPVVLVVVIIGMIVCGIFINRRWNKAKGQELNKEDPYLDGSSTEKVPMPMFEEDVPSVLELEMEELDQWMKKDYETAEDSKVA